MEGAKAYADHEKKSEIKDRGSRSVNDLLGWYEGVYQDTDGAIRGELNFIPGKSDWLLEAIKVNPSLVGLSINAKGQASRGKMDNKNVLIAESFDKVYSTDIVTEAAAGGEVVSLAASVTLEDEETKLEVEMTEEQTSWLQAEDKYKTNTALWLIAEKDEERRVATEKLTAIEQESTKRAIEEKLEKAPETWREYLKDKNPEDIEKFMEVLKREPAVAKETPPAVEPEKPKPGEEGYKPHFL
jgi:hypothetical protein